MTPQEKIKAKLEQTGIPAEEIKVYGSQIMITARCFDTANRWASVLCRFSHVRGPIQSFAYNKVNQNTCLRPSTHEVWLVAGTM